MATTKKPGCIERLRSLSKIQKIGFWCSIAIIFYTLTGFFAAPPLLKFILEKKIPESLHRNASIEKIKLNPFTLTATIDNFVLRQQENTANFISFDRLFVDMQISSLIKRALVITSFQISGPQVNFTRLSGSEYTFSDLLTGSDNEKASEPPRV